MKENQLQLSASVKSIGQSSYLKTSLGLDKAWNVAQSCVVSQDIPLLLNPCHNHNKKLSVEPANDVTFAALGVSLLKQATEK